MFGYWGGWDRGVEEVYGDLVLGWVCCEGLGGEGWG